MAGVGRIGSGGDGEREEGEKMEQNRRLPERKKDGGFCSRVTHAVGCCQ
jgi:hypothetical protein